MNPQVATWTWNAIAAPLPRVDAAPLSSQFGPLTGRGPLRRTAEINTGTLQHPKACTKHETTLPGDMQAQCPRIPLESPSSDQCATIPKTMIGSPSAPSCQSTRSSMTASPSLPISRARPPAPRLSLLFPHPPPVPSPPPPPGDPITAPRPPPVCPPPSLRRRPDPSPWGHRLLAPFSFERCPSFPFPQPFPRAGARGEGPGGRGQRGATGGWGRTGRGNRGGGAPRSLKHTNNASGTWARASARTKPKSRDGLGEECAFSEWKRRAHPKQKTAMVLSGP